MKNSIAFLTLLVLAGGLAAGCVGVPATRIIVKKDAKTGAVSYDITSPKQVSLEALEVDESTGHVKIGKLQSINDATVISSQGQVNVDYLHEVRGLVTDVGALAVKGAAKGATGGIAP